MPHEILERLHPNFLSLEEWRRLLPTISKAGADALAEYQPDLETAEECAERIFASMLVSGGLAEVDR